MPTSLIPFAVLGGILEAVGVVLEKKVLRKHRINYKDYHVYGFLALVLVMLPITWFFWRISPEALTLKNAGIFAFIIIASIAANLLTFYAIKWEKITELEPIRLFQPLFIIFFAFVFYASERQTSAGILAAALISSLALIFSHLKKHHLKFSKYSLAALAGTLFFAVELVASKEILAFYSPLSFYFIRCAFIFLISLLIFRSKPDSIGRKSWKYVFIIAAVWVAYRTLLYFGYINYGVIFTTLLFILAPVFIYILAAMFLKEKLSKRNIIATIIILACVAYALLVA